MIYVPLMKDLGMRWSDIKNTPRHELMGLVVALREHQAYHSMDGYTAEDVSEMAKNLLGFKLNDKKINIKLKFYSVKFKINFIIGVIYTKNITAIDKTA